MPAAKIIQMGETPISQISRQLTSGIQEVLHVMFAVFAILKQGAAIRATTAGRTPQKNLFT